MKNIRYPCIRWILKNFCGHVMKSHGGYHEKLLLKAKNLPEMQCTGNLMRICFSYMLIGGMPQAVEAYLEHNNLQVVDEVKKGNR